uniref:Ig-like domain-containing protein n=1 Tax=Oryzias sinensis TaxID=183150 RepID=A0A8C7YDA2_9TELE
MLLPQQTTEENKVILLHTLKDLTCAPPSLWRLRPLPLTPSRPPGFIITAERGQNVSLTCDLPDPDGAGVLEWTRADLKEAYVFRDRTPDPDLQHPSFRNRVSLQDGPMGGPDRSVVLQEVTLDDSGTYECRLLHGGPDSGPISTIQLVVVPGESEELRPHAAALQDGL